MELKQHLKNGGMASGLMLSELYTPNLAKLLARQGFDFLLMDCEHGYFDLIEAANLIAVAEGCGLPVIVRVAQNCQSAITKYLDMGACGILLANAAGTKEIQELVQLCLYGPEGGRGISTFRAHTGYQNSNSWGSMCEANRRVMVIAQIESVEAVQQMDSIAAIPGLDGAMVGPNDLTQHMGIFGQYAHPDLLAAMCRVAQTMEKAGKWSGIITANEGLLHAGRRYGMRCFSAGSELSALAAGAKKQLEILRDILREEEPASQTAI